MKRISFILALVLAAGLLVALETTGQTPQPLATTQKWEHAVVKWDGPDRIYYNMPDKFELVHVSKEVKIPREAQPEEFCLAYAANKLAKEGWEAISIDSRRILFRRAK